MTTNHFGTRRNSFRPKIELKSTWCNFYFSADAINDYCRKDKSLGVLSQKFLMLFLVAEVSLVIHSRNLEKDMYQAAINSQSSDIGRTKVTHFWSKPICRHIGLQGERGKRSFLQSVHHRSFVSLPKVMYELLYV